MFEDNDPSTQAGLPSGEWETLAALTGFKPDPPPGKRPSPTLIQTAEPPEDHASAEPVDEIPSGEAEDSIPQKATPKTDLLDPEDLLESEEDKATTKPTLWTNPWAKGGFVASIIGVGVAGLGLFLWSVQNIKPSAKLPEPSQQTQTADKTQVDPEQEQIGNLKTVNALGSQAQALNRQTQMQNGLQPKPQPHPSPTAAPRATPPAVAPDQSTPLPSYSSVSPAPARVASISPPPIRPAVASAPVQTVDPQTAWQQALTTGSYGQMPDNPSTAYPDQDTEPLRTPPAVPANATLVASRPQPNREAAVSTLEDSHYQADVNAILSGNASDFRTVLPGAMATATLQTPIFWAQDLKAEQQPQRFSIRLNDAIPSANGAIAFPAGTQLIAQVSSISESGMVQLAVTHAVIETPQGGQVIDLPPETVLITGDEGKPILAELQNSGRGQVARMDVQTALFGALGQVGQLLNRPRNESTTTSPYLSSTSISNGDTNIVGGILQGAFGSLTQQVQQRHQQEMQDILNRPNLWIVPAGQRLQVFVNNSFGVAQP
jgi:hypothetical protein